MSCKMDVYLHFIWFGKKLDYISKENQNIHNLDNIMSSNDTIKRWMLRNGCQGNTILWVDNFEDNSTYYQKMFSEKNPDSNINICDINDIIQQFSKYEKSLIDVIPLHIRDYKCLKIDEKDTSLYKEFAESTVISNFIKKFFECEKKVENRCADDVPIYYPDDINYAMISDILRMFICSRYKTPNAINIYIWIPMKM